jgi:Zn-dependent membrane protease YugP
MILVNLLAIILVGVIGAALIFAVVAKSYVWISYVKGNYTAANNGLTGEQAATLLLNNLNLTDVKIQKASWFAAIVYGNHYNARKKTIYLRGNIFNKSTITSISLAVQKVGLVIQDVNKEKKFKVKAALQPFIFLAPILFVPLSLLGLLLDLVLFKNIGVVTLVFIGLAFLFYLTAFIFTVVTIPVENKANKLALEMIQKTNLLDESEQDKVKRIYKAYLISYVADLIISLLYLIKYALKLINVVAKKKR